MGDARADDDDSPNTCDSEDPGLGDLPLSHGIEVSGSGDDVKMRPVFGNCAENELAAVLTKRANHLKTAAQTFESKPEISNADASHLQGLSWDAGSVNEFLKQACDPEEDRTNEVFSGALMERGALPAHSPLVVETNAEIQKIMDIIMSLREEVLNEKTRIGDKRKLLAEREKEIKVKQEALAVERKRTQKQDAENRNYPRPKWLTQLEGTINVGVVGNAGVGKSLLVNRLRGVHPGAPGWAAVGVQETTTQIAMYAFPGDRRVRLWDFPGAGTALFPLAAYIRLMGLKYLDRVIVATAGRYTETEIALIEELRKFKIPYTLVRTKVDIDVWNNKMDNNVDEGETLKIISEDIRSNSRVSRPYLVSLRDVTRYEFNAFVVDVFPGLASTRAQSMDGGWEDAWSLPQAAPRTLAAIQGRWRDPTCSYHVHGNQCHICREGVAAIVRLEEDEHGRVWWVSRWWISEDSVMHAKMSSQLRWSPLDVRLCQPLVWTWAD